MYDSEDEKTTKLYDVDACVLSNNDQIKRRMKDVKVEELNGPVSTAALNSSRSKSDICTTRPCTLRNGNALSPPSCMIQEAEQRSTLSNETNKQQPAAPMQGNAPKNRSITSYPRVACFDYGLTAAAQTPQPDTARIKSTLTLGKGVFFTFQSFINYLYINCYLITFFL